MQMTSQWPHRLPDHRWQLLSHRWLNAGLVLRKRLVSRKETWEIGTPAPPRAGPPGLLFLHALSLYSRTALASFPDLTDSPAVRSVLVGQAGMQKGLTLLALAACVALHTSEGEWGTCFLNLWWKERGLPPQIQLGESGTASNLGWEFRSLQVGISNYLQENKFIFLISKNNFQEGTSFEQEC